MRKLGTWYWCIWILQKGRRKSEEQNFGRNNQGCTIAFHAAGYPIAVLHAAQNGQQFRKAIDGIKDAIPHRLLIDGQNPLTLLHAALSKGLHNRSDELCLELATDIRLILAKLAGLLVRTSVE